MVPLVLFSHAVCPVFFVHFCLLFLSIPIVGPQINMSLDAQLEVLEHQSFRGTEILFSLLILYLNVLHHTDKLEVTSTVFAYWYIDS